MLRPIVSPSGMGRSLPHVQQSLCDRRAHRAGSHAKQVCGLCLREAEVVVRDHNGALAFCKEREQPTRFESIEGCIKLVSRRALLLTMKRREAPAPAARAAQRDAEEPA